MRGFSKRAKVNYSLSVSPVIFLRETRRVSEGVYLAWADLAEGALHLSDILFYFFKGSFFQSLNFCKQMQHVRISLGPLFLNYCF